MGNGSVYHEENPAEIEWKALEEENKQDPSLFTSALAGENIDKNRYSSVLAPDGSRVKLKATRGMTSDYINANYIDGIHSNAKRAYIATQAPKPETIKDFWKMVWEQNVGILIMLTNLEEKGRLKANQYWPKTGSKSYGSTTVTFSGIEAENQNWCVRKFVLRPGNNDLKAPTMFHKVGEPPVSPETSKIESRPVYQYHFTTWPDMGVPEAAPLLEMMESVNETWLKISSGAPVPPTISPLEEGSCPSQILVHCSAGIGRTVTYVLIHTTVSKML
jgi:receptor-type tyrosine-protein phosphatase gamma